MTTENTSTDLVISYTVASNGYLSEEYPKLEAALANGYRAIEIISTPMNVGSGNYGGVCITVLLVNPRSSTEYAGGKK
jgi:hypothetical protein